MTYYFNFESALGGYKGFNGIHIKQHLPPLKPHYHYIDNSLQRRGIILSPRFSPTLSSANLRTNDSIPSAMSLTYNRLNFPQKFSSYNAQKCINLMMIYNVYENGFFWKKNRTCQRCQITMCIKISIFIIFGHATSYVSIPIVNNVFNLTYRELL